MPPTSLTDDPNSYPPSIQVPATSDPRTADSVQTPFQMLANRAANTKFRLDTIAPYNAAGYSPALPAGVTMGNVALIATSIAALQSVTVGGRFDGQLAIVKDSAAYIFDALDASAPVSPQIIQPADLPANGRWRALGLVPVDSTARVAAASVRNGIVAYGHVEIGIFSTNSTAYVDVTGSAITIPGLVIGDIVSWDYGGPVAIQATSTFGTQGVVVRPDTTTAIPSNMSAIVTNTSSGVSPSGTALPPCAGTYVCTQAGTHVFKVQAQSGSSSAVQNINALNSRVLVMRP